MSDVTNYAVVNAEGLVVNLILWDGEGELDVGEGLVLVVAGDAQIGWTYDGTLFHAPAAPVIPPPTPAQILATNTAMRNQLLAAATLAIAPLQDAVDIGEATDADTAMLTAWKTFRVAVNRVVLTVQNPTWPTPPQPGYGAVLAHPVSNA